jgi:hypothetical protein
MTNDAKLGLLAGVAGVVTAAFFHRTPVETPAPPVQTATSVQPANPPRVAGAVRATPARPEVSAVPVSRSVDED